MKKFLLIILILCFVAGLLGLYAYKAIFSPVVQLDVQKQVSFYIPSEANAESLAQSLVEQNILSDTAIYVKVADLMKFKKPKAGHYIIKDGWSLKELVSTLRAGRQQPIKLTFNNYRKVDQLFGYLGTVLEPDSAAIAQFMLSEKVLEAYEVSEESLMTLFIPNTYEFYWNSSPETIMKKLVKEQQKFFNPDRLTKAKALDLSPSEVYTLAAIVQKETLVNDEKPRVAGVYLNRLRRGQLLQADPTVVYANGDFELRRVLNKHLKVDSPYNTYKYEGLPPGPICMPDASSIDAVLNYEKHKYLYFCASPDNSGRHVFARNLIEHNRNADKYRAYLNKARIFK